MEISLDLDSPFHVRQYQLRCALASLHAAATQLPYFFAQLRTVARLSDVNEQISELRYLTVYVLDLLKRTKSETRAPSIIPFGIIAEIIVGIHDALTWHTIMFSSSLSLLLYFSLRVNSRPNTE